MTQPGGEWRQCPPGEIERLAGRLRQRRRRRLWLRSSALAATVVVLAAAVMLWSLGEPNYGGLTCTDVISFAEDYRNDRLEPELRAHVVTHLENCPNCRAHYEEMGISVRGSGSARTQLALRCDQPARTAMRLAALRI